MSTVFYASMQADSRERSTRAKVAALFDAAGFAALLRKDDLTAVKLHFGERGNDGFINPIFVRSVVDRVRDSGANPFLTDTNTLYSGMRSNAADHSTTAILHGFGYATAGAPIVIADGLRGENERVVTVGLRHFATAFIAGAIGSADSMIVLSHFKGHQMAGFGGAIKNLAMGCATPRGKREQHCTRPCVNPDACVACGRCVETCPAGAIRIEDGHARIDRNACIGCGECMTVCGAKAIELDWATELGPFTERVVEYAYAAVHEKKERVGYMNFVLRVTPDCDCAPWSSVSIVPDIGVLASLDPVALDQACLDLVSRATPLPGSALDRGHVCAGHDGKTDAFSAMRPHTVGVRQLSYAEEIGMGSRKYVLEEI